MNRGLLLISPMVLVRLLSVEQFGQYREFLLYTSALATFAAFSINSSLLRFVPHQPQYGWRFVDQALAMTAAASLVVIAGAAAVDTVLGGAFLGEYLLPTLLYVALFVNFDFWEALWLAQRRTAVVFAYGTGRLVARLTVVIVAAVLTNDINIIIWSLVALEAVRLAVSVGAWLRVRQPVTSAPAELWREQWRFCGPMGAAAVLLMLNRSLGGFVVAKMMGPVALAHYAIGTYVQPILAVLRNSMSDALLPEMSAQHGSGKADPLVAWKRMTILAAILLMGSAVVIARFAEILVVTLFTEEYREAVIILQIYTLVLVREITDFAVPLRTINRTDPIMRSNIFAIALNGALVISLLPLMGVAGAALAFVVSRLCEGAYLARETARAYEIPLRELARWGDLGRVGASVALASLTLYGSFWTDSYGFFGVFAASTCFALLYAALLLFFRVPEAISLVTRVLKLPRALLQSR